MENKAGYKVKISHQWILLIQYVITTEKGLNKWSIKKNCPTLLPFMGQYNPKQVNFQKKTFLKIKRQFVSFSLIV